MEKAGLKSSSHTPITYLLSTSLTSCNLKNGFRRFVPHIVRNNNQCSSSFTSILRAHSSIAEPHNMSPVKASVAVTPARTLHVSKVGQSKKGKTKQAICKSNFHANESESSLWPKRLAHWWHQQLPTLAPSRLLGWSPHWRCANTTEPHTIHFSCGPRELSQFLQKPGLE